MKLLYAEEHVSCYNYSTRNPLIEVIEKEKGESFEINSSKNAIFFVLRGEILLSAGLINNKLINSGNMFVHPGRSKGKIQVKEKCTLIAMALNANLSFCEHFSIEKLCMENTSEMNDDVYLLGTNIIAQDYLHSLERYINNGLRCIYFFELKLKEFLYILRAYYPKEELQLFFQPIVNKDMEFSRQVLENADKAKTVKELADLLNYSLSGFEKRFKKVFDMSASKWIEQNKARAIYHEINCSNKTIMEIAYDFEFSPPHFNDYCKRLFKKTPNQLRKQEN